MKSKPQPKPKPLSPVVKPSRKIDRFAEIELFVRAGGRCQLDICNEYLLEHHLTLTSGNFAQKGHIVAYRERGPRGGEMRPAHINSVSNLMLLCHRCHKLIDDDPATYTRETLEGYKKSNEGRIFHVTGLGPELKTSIVSIISKIGEQTVRVPYDHILKAIAPRYPISKEGLQIDLTVLPTTSDEFIKMACDAIDDHLRSFLRHGGEVARSNHISLFALAPMPVLIYLGSRLSNKIPLNLYQRHRDTGDWSWKADGPQVSFDFQQVQRGSAADQAALILSLSGTIEPAKLPADVRQNASIYALSLAGVAPNPTFLRTKQVLEDFKLQYHLAIAQIAKNHPKASHIHLFPAVPAPVAVLCGHELLPKAHPALKVYDYDKGRGGFNYQLAVNE